MAWKIAIRCNLKSLSSQLSTDMTSSLRFCPGKCDPQILNRTEQFYLKHFQKGDKLHFARGTFNHFLFMLDGEMILNSVECHNFHLSKDHYAFLYHDFEYDTVVVTDNTTLLVADFTIDDSRICDPVEEDTIVSSIRSKHRVFSMFEFNDLIRNWTESLAIHIEANNLSCKMFNRIKMQELFIIFKFYCSKEEQLNMFHHLYDSKMNFRMLCDTYILSVHKIEDLARICNMSLSYFKNTFQKEYNESPHKYMQEQRAEEIKTLIANKTSIKEIIQKLGFTDHSHFNRFCKKHLGLLPSEM